jgi:hypothetical protein
MKLDVATSVLGDRARARLKGSWAEGIRLKVMPLLLDAEAEFAAIYCENNGRPNWSVARMLGILLLAEFSDLSDQEALDCLSFDVRWQYALDLRADEAYLSRRSLVEFRSRLVAHDPQMQGLERLFAEVSKAAIKDLKLSFSEQRLDSTHVMSNIKTRSRADLFAKTLRHFLGFMVGDLAPRLKLLSLPVQEWFGQEEEGWFGQRSDAEYRKCVEEFAKWLYEAKTVFASDAEVKALESYQLVVRVLNEHCDEVADTQEGGGSDDTGGSKVRVRTSARSPGTSLQSPYDPDAGRGYKGSGYSVHITETCRNSSVEMITDFSVVPASTDAGKALDVARRLEANGLKAQTLYADAGYGSGLTIVELRNLGVDLQAPVSRGPTAKDAIGRERFTYDEQGDVIACPQGHKPRAHKFIRSLLEVGTKTRHAIFEGRICNECPVRTRCCTRLDGQHSKNYQMEITDRVRARDTRLAEQQTEAFRQRYAIRSGIEATNSALKRTHGLARLRVRRLSRVRLAVAFKLMAFNIKRWVAQVAVVFCDESYARITSLLIVALLFPAKHGLFRN